jgi:hypothetical protein
MKGWLLSNERGPENQAVGWLAVFRPCHLQCPVVGIVERLWTSLMYPEGLRETTEKMRAHALSMGVL